MTQVAIPVVYGAGEDGQDVVDHGGYVAQVVGSVYEKVKPRWSDLQREKLMQAGRPADDKTLKRLLHGFPADWANSFARHNKLVGVERGVCEFVPRLPMAADAGDNYRDVELDAYNVLDTYRAEAEAKKQAQQRRQVPKYFLHQVFSDASVAEKLSLDAGIMIVVSRIAVGNPKAACDLIVKHAKANGLDVTVRVGDYSTSRKASRQRLLGAAAGCTAEPYTCEVIGGKVAVRGVSGQGVSREWTVIADLWQMPEVDAVYRLASAKGATIVNTLFTLDMAKLGVELVTDREDYGFDVQLHVGEYDGSVSGNRVSTFGEIVSEAARGVFPIICDGKVVASAVYAGDRKFFVNWHVISELHERMQDKGASVSIQLDFTKDELVGLSLLNEVSDDVWLAEMEVGYDDRLSDLNPPFCRVAEAGESVVALYAVPTGVESTDSVHVENYDVGTICMPRFPQARLGMSGAALVAVSDGALLGSYTGSNRTYSLGSSVHTRSGFDWLGKVSVPIAASHAYISGKGASAIYQDLKSRGLGSQISSISDAIQYVSSEGKMAGSQYVHKAGAATTLDPTVWNITDQAGSTLNFVRTADGGVRPTSIGENFGPSGRLPVLEEKVFAVYKDGKSVIFSDLLTVTWIASDGSRCRLNGVPAFEGKVMKGSVLVALGDCAPLGLLAKVDSAAWGAYSECALWSSYFGLTAVGAIVSQKQGLFQRLSSRFKSLKTTTWEESDVRALVVGDVSSAGAYSRVGVAATLATVLGHFSQQDVQGIEKLITSRFHDDAWMMDLCEKVLPGGSGLFGTSCADKLNTLRIFLGLVYLREGNEGLTYVLDEIGLFDVEGYGEIGVADRAFTRRPRSVP